MGSGGGNTVTQSDPWKGVQPYLRQNYQASQGVTQNPPKFYPGQTFLGPQAGEAAAWQQGMNYQNDFFGTGVRRTPGSGPAPTYGMDNAPAEFGSNNPWYDPTGQGPQSNPWYSPNVWGGINDQLMQGTTAKAQPSQFPSGYDAFGNSPDLVGQHEAATQAWRDYSANMAGDPSAPFQVSRGTGENPYQTAKDFMATKYADLPDLKNATRMTGGALGMNPESQRLFNASPWGKLVSTAPNGWDQNRGPDTNGFNFQGIAGANNQLLQGGPQAGMYGAIAPFAANNIAGQFGGPTNIVGDWQAGYNPQGIGFNPNQYAQQAWDPLQGIDARSAVSQQLSGQADYGGLNEAVKAATRPMFDQLREEVLPSLRSDTNALTNPTGELKEQNRIIPRMLRDVGDIGAQMAWQERQRATGSQLDAAKLATQSGLQSQGLGLEGYGLGLQGAGMRSGLDQWLQGKMTDLGITNAQLGLQSDMGQQAERAGYRGDVLGLGGLGNAIGGQLGRDMLGGLGMSPQTYNMGKDPSQLQGAYADWMRGFGEKGIMEDMSRFNYNEQTPMNMQQFMSGILSGAGGLGGTQTQTGSSNPMLGAAGGAMSAAGLSSMLGAAELGGASGAAMGTAAMPYLWPMLLGGAALGAFS